jgi:hypothetical protein
MSEAVIGRIWTRERVVLELAGECPSDKRGKRQCYEGGEASESVLLVDWQNQG